MAEQPSSGPTIWTGAALVASLIALAGSLYLSLGMELVACPLCFYQRTFVMAVVGVLVAGLLLGTERLSLLALPAAVGGVGVAAFHVWLELMGTLACPAGILGLGTAPQQSLLALTILLALLVRDLTKSGALRGKGMLGLLIGIALGVFFTWGSIASAPKLPDPPSKPYDAPPKICRPPYVAKSDQPSPPIP